MAQNRKGSFCFFMFRYRRTKENGCNNSQAEYVFIEVPLMKTYNN